MESPSPREGSDRAYNKRQCPGNGATQVSEKTTRVGQTLCMALCPDDPFSVAYAGDNKQCYIETTDLTISEQVMHRFGSRPLVSISTENTESMET
ncbi:unnamed protein product [Leptidea sinapis]|uniref:Uncharacterized protein n=1 Tax=Leptidea sinapis TaxID=189913 RepID=A0A5E4QJ30_9NEOP|nr:unnamed protein product [Leptidea sinapis]